MMALNRFRLRVLVRTGHRGAKIAADLLARTDRLLGVILLMNNLVNAAAAVLVSIITVGLFGQDKVALGFVLLTLTLATGIVYSESIFGQAIPFTHKTVFAIASWLIFAALLTGRYLRGWRGRAALRWTLAGFVSLLLAYVGSRFVMEVILHRPQA